MTPAEYRAALATLGLSQLAAGRWLGVSNKTAQRYATDGPSGPAARAVAMRLEAGRLVALVLALNPTAGELGEGMARELIDRAQRLDKVMRGE